jgi:hypothetical protein
MRTSLVGTNDVMSVVLLGRGYRSTVTLRAEMVTACPGFFGLYQTLLDLHHTWSV